MHDRYSGLFYRHQRGQALVVGIFVLIAGLAALFYLFNTGQLLQDKTRLATTADAVAYSAGVMHARTLNFEAYTNRAMIANTVTIAQLVSLSSWAKYAISLGKDENELLINIEKYPTFYPSYLAAKRSRKTLQEIAGEEENDASRYRRKNGLEEMAKNIDDLIRKVLMNAQQVAYQGLPEARKKVMNEVAQANYYAEGRVSVANDGEDEVTLNEQRFEDFITGYDQDKRTRFAETVRTAMEKEDFVNKRDWDLLALPVTSCAPLQLDELHRRGGTNLIGFDEWQAIDTLSEHRWFRLKYDTVLCTGRAEIPLGWSTQVAAKQKSSNGNVTDSERKALHRSLAINPAATILAVSSSSKNWDYSGLPGFYDLSEAMLKEDDPTLEFAVRVKRNIKETKTAEGRSLLKNTPRLNAYEAKLAGGDEMVSVSASVVYFERPFVGGNSDSGQSLPNEYGEKLGKPREIGSLFNPFWQVRLTNPDRYVTKAQAAQGVVLP